MEPQQINIEMLPCEPASARRRPVSGPDGEKLVTEGNGGVESQAPPAATTTGRDTAEHAEQEPGPVPKKKPSARYCARKRRQMRRQQLRGAGAAPDTMLEPGNRRDGKKLNEPKAIPPHKHTHGGSNYRNKLKERKRREAEALETFYRQQKEGVLKLPDMAALAPSIAACMARVDYSAETDKRMPASEKEGVQCGETVTPAGSDAEPNKVDGSPDRMSLTEKTCKNADLDTGKNWVQSQGDSFATASAAHPQSMLTPATGQSKGKGVGKGRKGRAGAVAAVEEDSTEDRPQMDNREDDANRGAKRQRSSDLVSPTVRAADKKVCLEGGSAAPVANPVVTSCNNKETTNTKATGRGNQSSYADVTKMTRVVILDKAGIQMDEDRAMCLKKMIHKAQFELFKSNRGKPKDERTLPTFSQGPRLAHGGLMMTPASDFATNWLHSAVKQMPDLWEGSGGLKVVLEKDVPKYNTAVIYVPDFGTSEDDPAGWPTTLREFLADLNGDIDINKWPIFTHLVKQRGMSFNHVLVMGVPDEDLDKLRRINFRLFYTSATVFVKIKPGRKTGGPSTAYTGDTAQLAPSSEYPETLTKDTNKDSQGTKEHTGLTKEEEELLLQVDDEGAEDFLGVFRNLNVLSPALPTDAEKPGPSSANPQ